jgi:endonuclease G
MKRTFLILSVLIYMSLNLAAQDSQVDKSRIIDASLDMSHLLNLFTIHGAPKNQTEDSVTIIINHGYCLGFSLKYNQPLWAAYQVSKVNKYKFKDVNNRTRDISTDVDYERFPFFVDDARLPIANRIGSQTFPDGHDRGHMVPNEAINRQYGKMSQMETFIMSNISPQKKELNQGMWMRLEGDILNKYANTVKDSTHVWILTGPIFSANPSWITRPNGTKVAIPDSFFCILVRPIRYPHDTPSNAQYIAFVFPQHISQDEALSTRYVTSIDKIEQLTRLNFFSSFTLTQQNNIETKIAIALW